MQIVVVFKIRLNSRITINVIGIFTYDNIFET